MPPTIRPVEPDDAAEWLRLRLVLWPDGNVDEYRTDIEHFLHSTSPRPLPTLHAVFVCPHPVHDAVDGLCGLIEVSIRLYADGCETNNVGYIEGWVVDGDVRGQSIGRALVHAAEEWARGQDCQEMASDAEIDNHISYAAHQRLGYTEVGRIVQFCKRL